MSLLTLPRRNVKLRRREIIVRSQRMSLCFFIEVRDLRQHSGFLLFFLDGCLESTQTYWLVFRRLHFKAQLHFRDKYDFYNT